jgi:transposase-like protein
LSAHRDIAAAKQFLRRTIEKHSMPQKITLDGYAASHAAVAELLESEILPKDLTVRTNSFLNNLIEQDHRRVEQRVNRMLGFKRFEYVATTISGIELVHQIKKKQFDVSAFQLLKHDLHRYGLLCWLLEQYDQPRSCLTSICKLHQNYPGKATEPH